MLRKSLSRAFQRFQSTGVSARGFGTVTLSKESNQALDLGKFAIEFLREGLGNIDIDVVSKAKLLHADSVLCAVSALAQKTIPPSLLKAESMELSRVSRGRRAIPGYSFCFGSIKQGPTELAVAANCTAAREWNSSPINLIPIKSGASQVSFEMVRGNYYPIVVAGCQQNQATNGEHLVKGIILLDEIQTRLAEASPFRKHGIDDGIYAAIASTVTYGALMGGTAEQIESALGILVAHYVPYRAPRNGRDISHLDSLSAGLIVESAIISVHRSLRNFMGPRNIFKNPESIFRLFGKPEGFDLHLGGEGKDFANKRMQHKYGIYDFFALGPMEALFTLMLKEFFIMPGDTKNIQKIEIFVGSHGFERINRPNPKTRVDATNSIFYTSTPFHILFGHDLNLLK